MKSSSPKGKPPRSVSRGVCVTWTLAGLSHTKARRHKVKFCDHPMVPIDPHFAPPRKAL